MTRLTPIKYRVISDEFADLRIDAHLIDEDNAIEITEYGVMNIIGVAKTDEPGVYLSRGTVELGTTEDPVDIALVVDRLRSMTAYELVVLFMVRSNQPFRFDLINMAVVDPAPSTLLDEP